jgi:undecaprenyl-diphosphatase
MALFEGDGISDAAPPACHRCRQPEAVLPLFHIVVLALVQGITEFLPISSSGHLILVPGVTGWPDQGLVIDVAAHMGTLIAVLVYFWRDIAGMLAGLGRLAGGRLGAGRMDDGAKLALNIAVATLPALAIGFAVQHFLGDRLRSIHVVAWTMIGFAIVLYLADRIGLTVRRLEHMTMGQALVVGIAQTLAFVPGTSRSGITIVAARLLGYERAEAARFSFLLSIPAIAAAALLEGYHVVQAGDWGHLHDAALTAGLSALAGFAAIAFMMRWLRGANFTIFVVYRLLLGGALLYLIYFRGY